MGSKLDLTGFKFGRLEAISYINGSRKVKCKWLCFCDCGNEAVISTHNLTSGKTKSCGCISSELAVKRNTRHGMRHTKVYRTWAAIINRCRSEKSTGYHNYGGRGIDVCDRWLDFSCFYSDMGDQPNGSSIERIDVDSGYSPDNCIWIDNFKQAANRRTPKNNNSGVKGVCVTDDKVIAYWQDNGKQMRKSFSINKYGFSLAFSKACNVRDKAISDLINRGENYGKHR